MLAELFEDFPPSVCTLGSFLDNTKLVCVGGGVLTLNGRASIQRDL